MKISIIVSVYNEEEVLNSFYQSMIDVIALCKYDYELLFVNDGSSDNSQILIDNFVLQNPKVKSIVFSRNFGHEAAMIAGIDYSTGDALICMDSDLQHPPTIIPEMVKRFILGDVDIINMIRVNTKASWTSTLFYKVLNRISPFEIIENASDFFLISAKVGQILRDNYRERVRFLRGIIQIIGFKKTTLNFVAPERAYGKSKYSVSKLISLSVMAVATLSKMPLKIGIYLGLSGGLFSLILAIYS